MANDLNVVCLAGRLVKDLGSDANGRDFSYSSSGLCRAICTIASNKSKKNADGTWGDEVSFFDIVIWGKTAENLKPYLKKGTLIGIEGFLKQDRWQDQNGNQKSKLSIHAKTVQLMGKKATSEDNNHMQPPPQESAFKEDIPYTEDIDDIPF